MATTRKQTADSGCSSSADLAWFGVVAAFIPLWWDAARPYIEHALDRGHGEFLPDDIRTCLLSRAMQLWLLRRNDEIRGALVTEIADYPRLRTVILRLFSADRELRGQWEPLLAVIEDWARDQGCAAIEIFGRPGWARRLDYELTHVVLRKELKHE